MNDVELKQVLLVGFWGFGCPAVEEKRAKK
jgi:hypothetical protein